MTAHVWNCFRLLMCGFRGVLSISANLSIMYSICIYFVFQSVVHACSPALESSSHRRRHYVGLHFLQERPHGHLSHLHLERHHPVLSSHYQVNGEDLPKAMAGQHLILGDGWRRCVVCNLSMQFNIMVEGK